MSTITRGENSIIQRNLFYSNGTTPLLLADLETITAEIVQYDVVLATYVYETDPEIRQGTSASNIEIEVTTEVSQKFKEGPVYIRLTMEMTDAEYEVDLELKDIDKFEIFTVTL